MNTEVMSTETLMSMKNQIAVELRKRPDALQRVMTEKQKEKIALYDYAKRLIAFIDSQLDIKLAGKCRTQQLANYRFSISRHLHEKGMTLIPIGMCMRRDHSTIINGLRNAEYFINNWDISFGIQHKKINQLIWEFNILNS